MSKTSNDSPGDSPARKPVPERFTVAKSTLYFDRFMTSAIVFGGMGIIVAVFGIFAFIMGEILPLFKKASVEESESIDFQTSSEIVGLDEWSELPFTFDGNDTIRFFPIHGDQQIYSESLELQDGAAISAYDYDARNQRILVGTQDGQVGFVTVEYSSTLNENDQRVVSAEVETGDFFPVSETEPGVVSALDYADNGREKLFVALHGSSDSKLSVITLKQKRSLLGGGATTLDGIEDLTTLLDGAKPRSVLAAGTADSILVLTEDNEIIYLFHEPDAWVVRQKFQPFEDKSETVTNMDYLLGDVSVIVSSNTGHLRMYSLFIPEGENKRLYGMTKEFPSLKDDVELFVASQRNKSFLVANRDEFMICYATSAAVRKRMKLPFEPISVAIDAKGHHLGFLDAAGKVHLYEVDDHHPEAGWSAFFGKVWYEGSNRPRHVWQSTGGSDDFEPKLSLVPLIIGSLKGTFYAMLFAVPIALFAAVYVSHFAHNRVKKVVKPLMEIMASLPSVVLGFLAALWLAPLIESRVPSILAVIILLPLSIGVIGYVWSILPVRHRNRIPSGLEFAILIPVVLLVSLLGWNLGPVLERMFFVATMPDGTQLADFRLWWPQFTGLPYDQRNCLVVGFIMGFAVIPVIFTIAEDALANVPPSITSAADALGASRWQVVRTIVIPIAAAGIFSALMIGFGRAVGETMIVVMATGNTPIMDEAGRLLFGEMGLGNGKFPIADHWNIFNGMRTLSANIAVELPEAPVHSTHYRTLFLGAMVLFIMTFLLNTVAEILRQHLREKFKIV
tara:strand:- start:12444 stop:14813 length:2370 start_codon:yes stop_codon:yes gene_type:complete